MPEKSIVAAIVTGVTSLCVGAGTIIFTAMKISNQSEEIKTIKKSVIFEDRFVEYQKAQTTEHSRINDTLKEQNALLMKILENIPKS